MSGTTFSGLTSTIPAEIEEGVARLSREYAEGRAAAAECAMLRAEVREVAEKIHRCELELWRSAPGAEKIGRGTVALWLDAWATDLWIAIGDYPRPRVAGCGPCHDGRAAGSSTLPREGER